jgi:hypothetical protein
MVAATMGCKSSKQAGFTDSGVTGNFPVYLQIGEKWFVFWPGKTHLTSQKSPD